jgi:hypothetical protein
MKKFIIGYLVLLMACSDGHEEGAKEEVKAFNRKIGEQINTESGLRWMSNYRSQNSGARENEQEFKISKANLTNLLKAPNVLGITFHHANDDADQYRILAVPVVESAKLWSPTSCFVIDALTNKPIDIAIAKQWTDNYKQAHPNEIQYHFYGADIFEEIKRNNEFEIAQAIDDENKPQLLLIVKHNSASGRLKDALVTIYDRTDPCPPDCRE